MPMHFDRRPLVDCKHLGARVTVFQVEIACGFELDGLIVGIRIATWDIDFKVGVVEDVFLAFFDRWRGCRRQRWFGFGRSRRRRFAGLDRLIGEGSQLDRIGLT